MSSASGSSRLLSLPKLDCAEGTWEESEVAFQLFAGRAPPIFGSFGFHCTPHIGAYNHEDYTPTLPIALVSLPVADIHKQFPAGVAAVAQACLSRGLLSLDKLDCYLMIHSGLELRECGHLKCSNKDEFNLMYHSWVFAADGVADTSDEIIAHVHMGLFEPHGVAPVHLEFVDGGLAFDRLSQRRVILHDRRFSPNNANVRVDGSTDTPVFITFAVDRVLKMGVICVHVLPIGDAASDRIRGWIRGRVTLGDLVKGLEEHVPVAAAHVKRIVDGAS